MTGTPVSPGAPLHVYMVLVPDLVQLDLTGPFEVLARVPGWTVDLVAETPGPVRTDRGPAILPTATRASARPAHLLVVPGGAGIDAALTEDAWLDWVRAQANGASHVMGVCTGSLLLGAAGLLRGRRAGSHWQARDLLARFGAIVSDERVTRDGTLYTSAGVTSGIDLALRLVADIAGEFVARKIQLAMEYDPAPPFDGGSPRNAPREVIAAVLADSTPRRARREAQVDAAARRLAG